MNNQEDVQRLIDRFQHTLIWYPHWIDGIKNSHCSNIEKEYQIRDQNLRMEDDKIVLAALRQMQMNRDITVVQMRTEPCPECKNYANDFYYCPFCGRRSDGE